MSCFKTLASVLANAQKCWNEAYVDNIHVCLVSLCYMFLTTVRNPSSSRSDSSAQIQESSSSSGTSCHMWESTLVEQNLVSLILTLKPKLGLSLCHARRNSSNDGISATCWSSNNLAEKAAIFDLAILARHSQRVSLGDVTAHGKVQDWPSRECLGTRLQPRYSEVSSK